MKSRVHVCVLERVRAILRNAWLAPWGRVSNRRSERFDFAESQRVRLLVRTLIIEFK